MKIEISIFIDILTSSSNKYSLKLNTLNETGV